MKRYLLAFLIVVSCGTTEKSDNVVIAIAASPPTKDLQKATDNMSRAVFVHVYDSPMAFGTNGDILPALAESWEFINPTTLQLTLRQDVKFHNGKTMTADDVVASLNRLRIVPESQTMYVNIENVERVSDYKVNVNLKRIFPSIVGYLAHPKAAIYTLEDIEALGTNTVETPIGTGAYQYVNLIHGDRVILKAFPEYWAGAPAIENLEYKVIVDDSVRAISIESGDVQGVMDVSPSQVEALEGKENITLVPFNSISVEYLGMNATAPRLQNKKLREAIYMAVDKQALIDSVYFGFANPTESLFDSRMFGALTEPDDMTYNPELARQIIKEEGLEGYKLTLIANEGHRSKSAEVIQYFLKEIGINVEIRLLEWAAYLDILQQGSHELFILGWSNSTYDADNSMHTIFHSDNVGTGYNNFFYSNPQVDKLIEEAGVELNEQKRRQMYADAQKIIRDERYALFLFTRIYTLAFDSKLEGVELVPTGDHRLHRLRYK